MDFPEFSAPLLPPREYVVAAVGELSPEGLRVLGIYVIQPVVCCKTVFMRCNPSLSAEVKGHQGVKGKEKASK